MFPNHWTLTELHQLCWRCLRQPGPRLRSGTSKWTSSCTVSWSMKLQHFSCFAGAAACTPGCRRDGKAAHPSVKGCKPRRHWGRSWGKDRLGRKPGGGIYWICRCLSIPAGTSLPQFWNPVSSWELVRCSHQCLRQSWHGVRSCAGSVPLQSSPKERASLMIPRDCSSTQGPAPHCSGTQVNDTATFIVWFNMKLMEQLNPAQWTPGTMKGKITTHKYTQSEWQVPLLGPSLLVCVWKMDHPSGKSLGCMCRWPSLLTLVSYALPGSGEWISCHWVQGSPPARERTGSLSLSFYTCRKKPTTSRDNSLTQITFRSYLTLLVNHTNSLSGRLSGTLQRSSAWLFRLSGDLPVPIPLLDQVASARETVVQGSPLQYSCSFCLQNESRAVVSTFKPQQHPLQPATLLVGLPFSST